MIAAPANVSAVTCSYSWLTVRLSHLRHDTRRNSLILMETPQITRGGLTAWGYPDSAWRYPKLIVDSITDHPRGETPSRRVSHMIGSSLRLIP